jgi:hypothetical protein
MTKYIARQSTKKTTSLRIHLHQNPSQYMQKKPSPPPPYNLHVICVDPSNIVQHYDCHPMNVHSQHGSPATGVEGIVVVVGHRFEHSNFPFSTWDDELQLLPRHRLRPLRHPQLLHPHYYSCTYSCTHHTRTQSST